MKFGAAAIKDTVRMIDVAKPVGHGRTDPGVQVALEHCAHGAHRAKFRAANAVQLAWKHDGSREMHLACGRNLPPLDRRRKEIRNGPPQETAKA